MAHDFPLRCTKNGQIQYPDLKNILYFLKLTLHLLFNTFTQQKDTLFHYIINYKRENKRIRLPVHPSPYHLGSNKFPQCQLTNPISG